MLHIRLLGFYCKCITVIVYLAHFYNVRTVSIIFCGKRQYATDSVNKLKPLGLRYSRFMSPTCLTL